MLKDFIKCRFPSFIKVLKGLVYPFFEIKKDILLFLLLNNSKSDKTKILLLMTTSYGNLGDQAITLAECLFFEKYFSKKLFIINSEYLSNHCGVILNLFSNYFDKILITGGGFLGSIWVRNEIQVYSIVKGLKTKRIIIFPQSIFYEEKKIYKKLFLRSKNNYLKHNNITFFIRDQSYFFVKNTLLENKKKVINIPDIVLSLNYSQESECRKGVLFCLRHDKEKVINDLYIDNIKQCIKKLGERISETDTVIDKYIDNSNRVRCIEEKILEFKKSKLVITDRLHGMIFATISGTPCIAINNLSKKVEGVYSLWLSELDYIKVVDDLNKIDNALLVYLLNKGSCVYNSNRFQFYWNLLYMEVLNDC